MPFNSPGTIRISKSTIRSHHAYETSQKENHQVLFQSKTALEEALGCASADCFYVSAQRTLYQRCRDHRPLPSFEEGFSQRSGVGHAHADLLHQPWRAWSKLF